MAKIAAAVILIVGFELDWSDQPVKPLQIPPVAALGIRLRLAVLRSQDPRSEA